MSQDANPEQRAQEMAARVQDASLEQQAQELIARVLRLHARWRATDLDSYQEAIAHLDVLVTVATDMADSLHERLWEREEAGRN